MGFLRLVLLLFVLSTGLAYATTVLRVALPDMTRSAEHIFHGRVISNEVKLDDLSKRVVTFTTFDVIESVKGKTGVNHIIKQIGGQLADSNVIYITHGIPQFLVGKEYVVFLPKKSRLGFSSPIGLGQGSYSVLESDGIKTVNNQAGTKLQLLDGSRGTSSTGTPKTQAQVTADATLQLDKKVKLASFIKRVRKLTKN